MQNGWENVRDFGIIGDGATNQTGPLNAVLRKMAAAGGGTLYFPPGRYVTGTLNLYSHCTIWLEGGATLLGSENPGDFPLIGEESFPGWGPDSHAAMIFSHHATGVAVRGRGTIDGRGYNWWHKADESRPKLVEFICCDDVLVEDVTLTNSPMWTLHPLRSSNVEIRGVTIRNPADSPNTDGVNPESCQNVRVSGCLIDVGDDCVTLKLGRQDQPFHNAAPCENIAVVNCTMRNGHGGVVIGSEMTGGVRNVVISNCIFSGTDRGIRIKTRRLRGGFVENIRVSNIIMEQVWCPLVINCYYRCGTSGADLPVASNPGLEPVTKATPAIRRISLSHVLVTGAQSSACRVRGLPEQPVEDLSLSDVTIRMEDGAKARIPVMDYWESPVSGEGVRMQHVRGLSLRNVTVLGAKAPALLLTDVSGQTVRDFDAGEGWGIQQV